MQQPATCIAHQDETVFGSANDHSNHYITMEADGSPPKEDDIEDEAACEAAFEDEGLSLSPSIVESVMTADGIHDMPGFCVVCLVILIGDMSRGVFFPSMWPLVDYLGGSSVTLGYCVAAFSFGRILVSPLFGRWSVTYGYTTTLLFSCYTLLLGTFLYAQVQNVGSTGFLIAAQICLGIGSGTLGVTRAFVAEVTAQRNRTTYMAWITAVQYAGFTVTPFVGAIFNKTLGDSEYKLGIFRWNMFTAPAYFMSVVVILTIVNIRLYFKDRVRHTTDVCQKKSKKREAIDDHANQMTWIRMTIYDCCIAGCMLLNISTKGSISAFETLGIAIAESHFDMTSARAGTIVATCGTFGVLALLSMGHLAKYLTDIQLICGGMVVMASGIMSLTFVDDNAENETWRFCLAFFLIYSIGYPIGHTAVIGLFSKIVGRRPQGELLGWFASAGSLARLVFPIMSGYIANYLGIVTLFWVLTCILTVSTAITMYNRRTLKFLSS